jgi:tetratricopeptide (TPR) repeat protein
MKQKLQQLFLLAALSAVVLVPSARNSPGLEQIRSVAKSSQFESYSPAVKELLSRSYLGHGTQLPDPNEPFEVLKEYLFINSHTASLRWRQWQSDGPRIVPASYGYQQVQASPAAELDAQIQRWRELVREYPSSRYALLGLAKLENMRADNENDVSARLDAADHYIQAAEIALSRRQVRDTYEVSQVLVKLNDLSRLVSTFTKILAVARTAPPEDEYLALLDYADGLAQLQQQTLASKYFEDAIQRTRRIISGRLTDTAVCSSPKATLGGHLKYSTKCRQFTDLWRSLRYSSAERPCLHLGCLPTRLIMKLPSSESDSKVPQVVL